MGHRRVVLAAAGAAVVATGISLQPGLPYAFRSPALHAALETAGGAIALLAAGLAAGRFRRARLARDLALAASFGLFATANLAFSTVPTVVPVAGWEPFPTWAPLLTRLAAAVLFAAAALAGPRLVPRTWARRVIAVSALYALGVAVVVALLRARLPVGVGLAVEDAPFDLTALTAHPAVSAAQVAAGILYLVAAVGFSRHTGRHAVVESWLAGAALLGAFARLHYVLFPSLYSEVVYVGDLLRTGFYVLVLVGSIREVAVYQEAMGQRAATEERRRVARDLHDGLSHELAFIAARASALARRSPDEPLLQDIASAAHRALGEARQAITALTEPGDRPLGEAIARATEDVVTRFGVAAQLDLPRDVTCAAPARAQLVRIAREAATNAAAHGRADTITMTLAQADDGVVLEIRDDGVGFDPSAPSRGFGLTSMRERAEALGGTFILSSTRGEGTCVTVRIPKGPPAS